MFSGFRTTDWGDRKKRSYGDAIGAWPANVLSIDLCQNEFSLLTGEFAYLATANALQKARDVIARAKRLEAADR